MSEQLPGDAPHRGTSSPAARSRVPDRLDVRPLDLFRSFKVKLGVLVVSVVTVAALLTWISIRAGLQPLLAIPLVVLAALMFTQLLARGMTRSEEHTSELQSRGHLVCRLLLEKKKAGRIPRDAR